MCAKGHIGLGFKGEIAQPINGMILCKVAGSRAPVLMCPICSECVHTPPT